MAHNNAENPKRMAAAKAALNYLEKYDYVNRKAAKGTKDKLETALKTVRSNPEQRRSTIFDLITEPMQEGETMQGRAARVVEALRAFNFEEQEGM